MRSMLTAFAAITALALPAGLPAVALAATQSEAAEDAPPPNDVGARYQPDESRAAPTPAPRFEQPRVQEVQDRRGGGDRGGDRGGGQDRGGDRGGNGGGGDRGGWNRGGGDRGPGGGWNRGDNSPGRWNQNNNPPGVTPPPPPPGDQDRGGRGWDRGPGGRGGNGQDWNRGEDRRGRDNNGGWNGGNQGRDGRDRDWNRGNQGHGRDHNGWNGGNNWNNGQNNGGWDRDRNNGGRHWQSDRNGRRDYNGWNNRWNQNDWRRDWNRGRSNDWWRNDRGFRGYTGVRFGFYFAPNYGYYSVPRNYWGQRWYIGDYLPSIFWRYSLNDYRTYGLGYPPPGTQWVAVDNSIYLIDQYDGYIIEVIRDAWRW